MQGASFHSNARHCSVLSTFMYTNLLNLLNNSKVSTFINSILQKRKLVSKSLSNSRSTQLISGRTGNLNPSTMTLKSWLYQPCVTTYYIHLFHTVSLKSPHNGSNLSSQISFLKKKKKID